MAKPSIRELCPECFAALRQRVEELERELRLSTIDAANEMARANDAEKRVEGLEREAITARADCYEFNKACKRFRDRAEAAEAKADATIKLLATVTDDYDKAEAKLARCVDALAEVYGVMAEGYAIVPAQRWAAAIKAARAALAAAKGEE